MNKKITFSLPCFSWKAVQPLLRACWHVFFLLALALAAVSPAGVRAAVHGTLVPSDILVDTTWTEAGSPYQVNNLVTIHKGATLTIGPGVMVETVDINESYNFDVREGTLIAQGTADKPIQFNNTNDGWSGITINNGDDESSMNTGSILEYVILDGGGYGGSGVGGNLVLSNAEATVRHCTFMNSPGDGILSDNVANGGVAHVYDSTFMDNQGYAINFEDGSVNPVMSNLTATGNGAGLAVPYPPYLGNMVWINDATLHGSHTWENMGLPYLIIQTIVGADGVLAIEPGTLVLAQPGNDGLDVFGKILANGTASQPIRFEPADPQTGWSGIAIMGTDVLTKSTGSSFDYVTVSKGGNAGTCNLYITNGDAAVSNSRFEDSPASGVCPGAGATLVMTDTVLAGNQEYAVDVLDANAQLTFSNLTATGNMNDIIGLHGGVMTGEHNLSRNGINTYDVHGGYPEVASNGTLNVEPGVTVRFEYGRDLTVHGALTSMGEPANPITFTGIITEPGQWTGITIHGTPEHRAQADFSYTTLEYAGYGGGSMLDIQNADVTLDHCTLRYCSSTAIRVLPDLSASAQAVEMPGAAPVQASWSRFTDIGDAAIDNRSSEPAMAAFNWWGSPSGPTAEDNPGGMGSAIYGPVLYRPYLLGPDGSFVFLPLIPNRRKLPYH